MLIKSFEAATAFLIDYVISNSRPVIISLHGIPNQGKSTLGDLCRKSLYAHDLLGGRIISDIDYVETAARLTKDFMFLESTEYIHPSVEFSQQAFGKEPDLKVLIYKNRYELSPVITSSLRSNLFDLVVENPAATVKQI
jgi:hypothetical protein